MRWRRRRKAQVTFLWANGKGTLTTPVDTYVIEGWDLTGALSRAQEITRRDCEVR